MSRSQGKSPEEINEPVSHGGRDGTPAPGAAPGRALPERDESHPASHASDVTLQATFDAMWDGILVADVETRDFVHTNSTMCRMLGYSEKELLALSPTDIHPRDLAGLVEARLAALVAREIEVVEGLPTLRKNGTTFLSDISASPVTIHGRNCLLGVFRDVTPQRTAEAALREREARLERAESMARLGHYACDGDGGNYVCSNGMKEIWGFDRDSNPQFADCVARIHPEDSGWVMAEFAKCVQERRGFDFEHRIVHPDGTQLTIQSRGEVANGGPDGPPRWFATVMDITERKRAERALRENEERLRLVIEATHDAIWEWNVVTHEAYFSPRWQEILGYSGEEMPGVESAFFDLVHPDDRPVVEEALRRHFAENALFSVEFRLRHKDGTWRWVLSRGEAILDSGGRPFRMTGAIRDITERKEAEQRLRESEERLRLALSASGQGTWDLDIQTLTAFVSPEHARMLGYEPAEFSENESSFAQRLHPHDREGVFAAFEAYLRGDVPKFQEEFRLRTKSGAWKWILSTGMLVDRDAAGGPARMIGTHIDIDWRKEAEAKLQMSEERYRRLHESMADAFVEVDMTGRIVDSNPSYHHMLGYTAEELSRMTYVDLTPQRWHGFEARIVAEQILPLGKSEVYEKEYRGKDGTVFPVELRTFLLKDASGAPAGMWAIVRDITERQRMTRELVIKEQAMASAAAGLSMASLDGKVTYVNDAWLKLHGYDAAGEVLGSSVLDHLHNPAEATAAIGILRAQGRWTGELLRRRRDGSVFPAGTVANMVVDSSGEPLCFLASFQDITERKRAEAEIAAERDRLRQILDSQFGFVGVFSTDGVILEANQTPLKLMGLQRADVLGRRFWEIGWLKPGTEPRAQEAILRAARGEVIREDLLAQFPAVGERDLDAVFSPIYDAQGKIVNVIGFGVDITDRRRAEERVRENETRLKEAQRIAQTGSWELDLIENRLTWSDEVFRILEIDPETTGPSYDTYLDFVHPEDRDQVDMRYRRSLETREAFERTHRLLMPDGRIKHVLARGRSDFGAGGRPIRSVGTVQDITEKKAAEDRIHAQLREKEVLLREIHHRVKNNLQIISSLLHLQSAARKDPGVVNLFEDSRRRIQAMAAVHDVLYQSSDLGRVAIAAYFEKLVSALRATHARIGRDVQIVTRISVPFLDLPSAFPCGLIVSELVTNAFKYAFEGRGKGTISIVLSETAPGQLRLSVQDDGCGMPGGASQDTGGFGLRLVHLLVEQIGGSLEISSGPGTELSVTFPAGL